jgi:hypothetical protein
MEIRRLDLMVVLWHFSRSVGRWLRLTLWWFFRSYTAMENLR